MSEQNTGQLQTDVISDANSIADRGGVKHGPGIYDEKSINQERDGTKHMLMVGSVNGGVFAQYSEKPLDGKPWPGATYNGPKHTIGYGEGLRGETTVKAKVSATQGVYNTISSTNGYEDTTVERPGYGRVVLYSPRAKDLVARLAGRAIKQQLADMKKNKKAT